MAKKAKAKKVEGDPYNLTLVPPEPKNKGGRPRKEINERQVYLLAQTLLPMDSIATILGCNKSLLLERFPATLQKGRENRKSSLSQAMWHKALVEKNTTMQIWLSKQHLGYKEQYPMEQTQLNFQVMINEIPK